ncbi:MAG: hypothetical protein V1818_00065 [Candidatus Aenigmatarchaeota archaeon]
MKGQVFVLISIFVLIFLFSLRMGTETPALMEDDLFLEDFGNLKAETVRTIDMSLLSQQSIQSNLDSFISFSKDFYTRKGYQEDVQYSVSSSGNTTSVYLNITLQNGNSYLNENLIISRSLTVFA